MNHLGAVVTEGYLPPTASQQLVPAAYAEKAMASLMQLHSELMDEKERRVELFRKLMEREQALAELRMYVKMLEERAAMPAPVAAPPATVAPAVPLAPAAAGAAVSPRPAAAAPPPTAETRRVQTAAHVRPPMPPRVGQRPQEGWKVW